MGVLALAVAFLLPIKSAKAQNPADTLKSFGSLGTWSIECTPGPTGKVDRAIYRTLSPGNPQLENIIHEPAKTPGGREGLSVAEEGEIKAAVEIGDDKITIVLASIMRATKQNGRWVNIPLLPITQQTIQKIGNKIQVLDWHTINGGGTYVKDGFEYSFGGEIFG
jgi:hypothetical protein